MGRGSLRGPGVLRGAGLDRGAAGPEGGGVSAGVRPARARARRRACSRSAFTAAATVSRSFAATPSTSPTSATCRARSIELAQSGRLDFLSAVLFPSTCDVIRNLSGVWKLLYPSLYVRYLDLPQGAESAIAVGLLGGRARTSCGAISSEVGGAPADATRRSPRRSRLQRGRALIRRLYRGAAGRALERADRGAVPAAAGGGARAARRVPRPCAGVSRGGRGGARPRRATRSASSSWAPSANSRRSASIKTIERAGCFIVDDDFLLGNRLLDARRADRGRPARQPRPGLRAPLGPQLHALRAGSATASGAFSPTGRGGEGRRSDLRLARASATRRCSTGRCCEPGAEEAGIPCIAFKFAENTGQFQQFREQAGTFADSIKLWGAA